MNYFVIGEREIVLAFGLVGVKGAEVVTKDEALKAFYKVLILTEEVSQLLENEVLAWQKQGNFPLIVEVPGIYGPLAGKKSLTDSIREAIGIQI